MIEPYSDETPLCGSGVPPINHAEDLVRYLLTVIKRFGNTAVTCHMSLQWGASALWVRHTQGHELELLMKRNGDSDYNGEIHRAIAAIPPEMLRDDAWENAVQRLADAYRNEIYQRQRAAIAEKEKR